MFVGVAVAVGVLVAVAVGVFVDVGVLVAVAVDVLVGVAVAVLVGVGVVVTSPIFTTKASSAPPMVDWRGFDVGKSVEYVWPVT